MRQVSTLLCLLFCITISGYAQSTASETHDFITYDTTVAYYNQPANTWYLRISRPRNLFTAGSPDTASRPGIFTMPGIGEVGSDPSYLTRYGPHYWMNNGWDGSVQLGNGIHYPIIITVVEGQTSTSPYYLSALMDSLKKWYHIKPHGVHVAGLSMGAFEWGDLICYSAFAGDQHAMSGITSYVGLSGEGSTYDGNNFGFNYPGFQAYTIWAQKYGGKFWGMQGNMDERYDWNVRDAVNAGSPNSGYFAYTQDGGGAHCCWNDEYNPSQHDWQCVAPVTNTNIVNGTYPNSMGTYTKGSNLFQWMLRQGDTSLVGSATSVSKPTPIANAGTNQTITLPTSSVTLAGSGSESGGTIASYSWSQTGGPSTATISNTGIANPVISNLVAGTYTFQLTVTDSYGTQVTGTVTVTVNPAASSSAATPSGYQAVPGTIQAESYVSSVGVKTESTTDAGSGLDVGYIYQGDGMTYNINVATAGTYTLSLRVASALSGGVINVINSSGAVLATVNVPNTGGWQVWTTLTTTVTLAAGNQTFSLSSPATANWNINWFSFAQVVLPTPAANAGSNQTIQLPTSSVSLSGSGSESGGTIASYAWSQTSGPSTAAISNAGIANPVVGNLAVGTYVFTLTVTDNYGTKATSSVTVTVNAASSVSSASGYQAVPGTIQAETYVSSLGVQTESTTDAGGGSDVGYIYQGDWMTYNINVASAGSYTMSLRVASPLTGGVINIENGSGNVLATVSVPNTGGWQNWTTVTATVNLAAGQQAFTLQSPASPNWNINWFTLAAAGSGSGSAYAIPGTVQAENYSTMNSVQTETTTDAGGGLDVGYINQGSWMSYPVNVASAGSYTLNFRVATVYSGAGFQVQDGSGNVLATVALNNTGGWQNWANVTATVNLAAGQQTIKLVSVSQAGWNINWFSAVSNTYSGGYPIPGTVQAENYINMSGVATETTLDAGGGLDVGWIDLGDWMDYAVNVASAGTYTFSFRVSAANSGASFAVQDGFGNVYTTVTVPQTWSYQAFYTITANVTLSSGPQVIRLTSTSAVNWNINWFSAVQVYAVAGSSIVNGASTAAATSLSLDSAVSASGAAAIQIYPNPVRDAFQLAVNNTFTGKVIVQVLTPGGAAVKAFELNKEVSSQQWQLSVSGLPAGVYVVRIVGETWQETRKLIKL